MIETKDFQEDSLYSKVKEVERNYDYLRNGHPNWDINQILTILNFGVSMWNTEHMNRDLSASFSIKDTEKQDQGGMTYR